MKSTTGILVAVLLVGVLIIVAGCGKAASAPAPIDPTSTADQTQTTDQNGTTCEDQSTDGTQTPSMETPPSGDRLQVTPQGGVGQ